MDDVVGDGEVNEEQHEGGNVVHAVKKVSYFALSYACCFIGESLWENETQMAKSLRKSQGSISKVKQTMRAFLYLYFA